MTISCVEHILQTVDAGHIVILGQVLEGPHTVVGDGDFVCLRSFLGGDKDNAECSLCTIDGGRGGVLKDGDRLYVVCIDDLERRNLDVVYEDKRACTTFDRGDGATDTDTCVRTYLGIGEGDRKTGCRTLEATAYVRDRTSGHLSTHVHGRDRAGEVGFGLNRITDYYSIIQKSSILIKDDVDFLAGFYGQSLGYITKAGDCDARGRGREGESSVEVGHRIGFLGLVGDHRSDHGISLGVLDGTGDFVSGRAECCGDAQSAQEQHGQEKFGNRFHFSLG